MSRKRKNDNPNAGDNPRIRDNFAETDIAESDAFIVYADLEKPSLKETERILRDRGHKISHTTLWRWSKEHSWLEKRIRLGKTAGLKLLDLGTAAEALRVLGQEGTKFDIVSAVKGLESRIVRVMADKLLEKDPDGPKGKNTERPDYYIAMTKLLGDLEDVKRKGYQADVQTGTRPIEPKEPEKAKEPAPKPAEVPKIATVHLGPFPKPAGKVAK